MIQACLRSVFKNSAKDVSISNGGYMYHKYMTCSVLEHDCTCGYDVTYPMSSMKDAIEILDPFQNPFLHVGMMALTKQ